MTTTQTQALLNAETARQAFLVLTTSLVPVPPARVFAAQNLVEQTQNAARAAFRVSA